MADQPPTHSTAQLTETVDRVARLVDNYRRDLVFRAPESVPEHQARLLNTIWSVLVEAQHVAD